MVSLQTETCCSSFLILKCFNNSTFFNVVCITWKIKCWISLLCLQICDSCSIRTVIIKDLGVLVSTKLRSHQHDRLHFLPIRKDARLNACYNLLLFHRWLSTDFVFNSIETLTWVGHNFMEPRNVYRRQNVGTRPTEVRSPCQTVAGLGRIWRHFDALCFPRVQEIRQKSTKAERRRSMQNMVPHRCDLCADNQVKKFERLSSLREPYYFLNESVSRKGKR